MASGPITSWEIDGETVETVADFIFLGSKALQMVTVAMKLKDAYSLEGVMAVHAGEHTRKDYVHDELREQSMISHVISA